MSEPEETVKRVSHLMKSSNKSLTERVSILEHRMDKIEHEVSELKQKLLMEEENE